MNSVITTHKLDFEVADYAENIDPQHDWKRFKVGTCYGLWSCTPKSYLILAIKNKSKGNWHLDDTLQWFEFSAKRDGRSLIIMEFFLNQKFKRHLIEKRGFADIEGDSVEKTF